jgi:hypothetical protein
MTRHVLTGALLLLVCGGVAHADRVYIHDAAGRLRQIRDVDLQSDPANCGVVGHVCPASAPICRMGVCQACQTATDFDCDGRDNAQDNCPFRKNTWQEDRDTDNVGDVCDNCPDDKNTDQLNTDGAGDGGNACDEDDDNDLCLDGDDDKPLEDSSLVGWRIAENCPDANKRVYAWDGSQSDGDGVRNCADPDDDDDGTPDVDDPCPIDVGTQELACQSPPVVCPLATIFDVCQFGGCNQFLIRIVSVVYPPLIVEQFTVRSGVLFFYPSLQLSLDQLEKAVLDQQAEGMAAISRAAKAGDAVRIEIWSKDDRGAPARFVALAAKYDPVTVKIWKPVGESALLVSTAEGGTAVTIQRASVPVPDERLETNR